jgi:hypothetical protein
MNINLTKNEYKLLLDYIVLADWVINAHHAEKRKDVADYEMLMQKLYSFAKDMDCEELVHADRETNEYYTTRYYEETARVSEFIDDYDNDSFWDGLISRLAERDIDEQYGEESARRMSREEYMERTASIEEAYYEEFRRRGVEHLRVEEE